MKTRLWLGNIGTPALFSSLETPLWDKGNIVVGGVATTVVVRFSWSVGVVGSNN
jgi:hypothetical protein